MSEGHLDKLSANGGARGEHTLPPTVLAEPVEAQPQPSNHQAATNSFHF